MSEPCILAVDPGLTGACAYYFPSAPDRVRVEDMPVCDGEVNVAALVRQIQQMGPTMAVIERCGPRPTDGVRQAFGMGIAYASVRACVAFCQVPVTLVTPVSWKGKMKLAGGKEGKEQARSLCLDMFPACADRFARKMDHNRADAAALALYAARYLLPARVAA